MTQPAPAPPWSVPVAIHEVPETGRHFDLVADERTRAAIAEIAELTGVPRLEASFDVTRHGREGLRVLGRVSATVGQACVVTLEPVENEIDEPIDLVFTPAAPPGSDTEVEVPLEDAPEPLVGGAVDLGALATEFLILGIDPYPRKSDAVFESPAAGDLEEEAHPFAALAALRKGQGEGPT
jgi:uncharacterized metal-binding protein YceD (DUF177 family)